jgi:hypothetical protein
LITNVGSLAWVHSVNTLPSSVKAHARMIMFFVSGRHLKDNLSRSVFDLRSKIYAWQSLLVAMTRVESLFISTPVTAWEAPSNSTQRVG